MRKIHRDIVSALIFAKDEKLLMGMKDPQKGSVYLDCWHLPGGGVDEGEQKLDTLRREVQEEVGIDISPYKNTLVDDIGRGESEKVLKGSGETVLCKMNFNVYKVEIDDKNSEEIQPKLSDDLVIIKWFDIKDLKDCKLTPPSIKLFTRLGYLNH